MAARVLMILLAFFGGVGVATGTFAFILVIGIIPRILRKSNIYNVMLIENIIIAGVTLGNLSSLWHESFVFHIGNWAVVLYGLATGIFVGCTSVALAEIMHTMPIIMERNSLKRGIRYIIFFMAFGKMMGTLFYFVNRYDRF